MAELTVPQIDFSALGQLPQVYRQAQQEELTRNTLANLGQGSPTDQANRLIGSGSLPLAQLGLSMRNHQDETAHTAAQDAIAQQHWNITNARAAAAESRAQQDWDKQPDQYVPNPNAGQPGEPAYIDQYAQATQGANPMATPMGRAKMASQLGIDPKTPEGQLWVINGKLPSPPNNYEPNPDFGKVDGAKKYRPASGGPADPDTISADAVAKAGGNSAADTPQATVDFLADRSRLGDQRHLVGLARVPGLISRVQTAAQQREEAGIPISDQARAVVGNQVTLHARNVAEGKLGNIATTTEFYGNNALGAVDIAEKMSAEVPRTNYPKLNEALNSYHENKGDPKIVAFGGAINTLINDYAKFAGGGTPTDALRGEAYKMLNAAHSHEQFKAVAGMMRTEIERGKKSPSMVRQGFDGVYQPGGTGNGPVAAPQAGAAAPAAAPDPLGIR